MSKPNGQEVRYGILKSAVPLGLREYLTNEECAKYRRCSTKKLERERLNSEGPPYIRQGRLILYSRRAVDDWLAARTYRHRAEEAVAA